MDSLPTVEIDALVREAYRLGYEDRAKERDYDPGHALDLLTRDTPPGVGRSVPVDRPADPAGDPE